LNFDYFALVDVVGREKVVLEHNRCLLLFIS
jgi:hypothetical protein